MGGAFFGLGIQWLIWLYIIPLIFALIGFGFMRDCVRLVIFNRDLETQNRIAAAFYQAKQGIIGLSMSVVSFLIIYNRQELIKCIAGLF